MKEQVIREESTGLSPEEVVLGGSTEHQKLHM
jgi:hypothetical protein